jgi:hypothetical protein
MNAAPRNLLIMACVAATLPARADTVTQETVDGVTYQVTRRTMQVPVPQMTSQQQTVYRQQLTTQTLQHQQQYTVPVTQYQLVSTLHGRWNPFVTPYWTHHYEPVTTWQQQTGTVQIPVTQMTWAPETRTVQVPSTTYRTVDAIVSRIPISASSMAGGSGQMLASGATSTSPTTGPTATLAARPTAGTAIPLAGAPPTTTGGAGGRAMTSDPPREASGWQTPTPAPAPTTGLGGRY